ncbi:MULTISPECIES: N-acetylglutaminylglutamine amidotransferase [Mycolicibacterium]|uniref:asparagine synthase (glutamine-hydrolyzing) n=2 Tax=Mycolicibacterium TaxID=1866885 RepID=A1T7E0_MYCVP|nr:MULTISPECIES: N-acetylglutaminylglutamine amidotransferase [Mycolicibacterium]ABM13090.1 asparagine synthase (glutamine-hydrolyzing) [Mycolicibacterium vanbaalenii PYR-1]MCV7128841.1 N-acetylglutaminylglutamine amidotransferase [Mycolicibacterium vanbaalenii PYR-1]MDN4517748.1 N-acetylglutaminylglutamine amidotransferase [Mycolicibacterium austroafricanum]MDW5614988.1 N-acetylglutaminylglutamine amidotransferase [Mycolicibacterium sp. D5.8-2]PQP45699.1 N-acetylglutaminylglutamine amidotrans
MCGATGEVRLDGTTPNVRAVTAMAEVMVPRGPDSAGVWSQGRVALGHRRLKIIDLSEAGAQPMVDAELGLTIAWNGCIYNYEQLRDELSGHGYRFFSHSDTEVLLKGYHHWGDRFVDHLKGMFAFAIVERDSGRVLLGRDRLGIKPLYLTRTADRVRFASSLPALLAGGEVDTRIDPVALHHYMTFHSVVPAPRTILRGVEKLPPASLTAIEPDGRITTTTYWEPDFSRREERAGWSEKDWEDAVLESLRVAVKRRLVADVPVGCLLSGGVDSSLIVGLLAEAGQHGLATFSIGFESVGGVAGDEFKYSDIIADRFGTDHHQIRIGTERMLPALGGAIGAMSEPMVSHDCVAFYLLSQEVAKHVKVVQSGQGADEVFAGYHWYPPMGEPAAASVEGSVASYRAAFFDRDRDGYADIVSPGYLAADDPSELFVTEHFARPGAQTGVDRALRLDTTVMLVDDPVKRVDNMTMAWGLEGRVPFLDHELVELAATCPPQLKTAHDGKGVLKQAARQVIPSEVIDRPKGYFPVPALTHLEGPYLELVRDALYAPAAKERGLFRPDAVERLLADPNGRLTPLRGNELWQIALLELWLQRHGINGPAA